MTRKELIEAFNRVILKTKWDILSGGGSMDVATALVDSVGIDEKELKQTLRTFFGIEGNVVKDYVYFDINKLIKAISTSDILTVKKENENEKNNRGK